MAFPPPPDPSLATTAAAPPSIDWHAIAAMPEFQALTRRKRSFILKGCAFFLVYYFALPILVGFFPRLMETSFGPVNAAYLFALSQFFMAWIVAALYVKAAAGWDKAAHAIINRAEAR